MRFRPDEVKAFRLTSYQIDAELGTVVLGYAFDETHVFSERLDFGRRTRGGNLAGHGLDAGFERVVRLLHLAAGVSYYKAAAPGTIVVETGPLTPIEQRFCQDLYDKGLREFAWHAGLPLERRLTIETPLPRRSDVDRRIPLPADAGAATLLAPGTGSSPAAVALPSQGNQPLPPPAGLAPAGLPLRSSRVAAPPPAALAPPAGIGIPIGGGKDSAVVVEALRDLHPVLLSVNGHPAAHRVAAAAGLDLAVVHRKIDPQLFELNAAGARNGHVPVTAIVSLIAVAAGYRLGYDTTVMALEGSADEPTRIADRHEAGRRAGTVAGHSHGGASTVANGQDGGDGAGCGVRKSGDGTGGDQRNGGDGAGSGVRKSGDGARSGARKSGDGTGGDQRTLVEVNHQWSKSSEFEAALTAVLAGSVGPGVRYRSVLRDTGELDIAACFAGLPAYHRAFVSCNRAFTQGGGGDGWCGKCPKCRFVFLALATAMDPEQLVPIFGADLLDDPGQVAGFRDLFEEGRKPFECVGTRAETQLAFARLGRSPAWADHAVVRKLALEAHAAKGPGAPLVDHQRLDPGVVLRRVRAAVGDLTGP